MNDKERSQQMFVSFFGAGALLALALGALLALLVWIGNL